MYPDNMLKNLNITRGLIFSQTVLLKLVNKGATREDAYKIVQNAAMKVWEEKNTNLKQELLNSPEVKKYLSEIEIEEAFNYNKMLGNVDYIFNRTVYAD